MVIWNKLTPTGHFCSWHLSFLSFKVSSHHVSCAGRGSRAFRGCLPRELMSPSARLMVCTRKCSVTAARVTVGVLISTATRLPALDKEGSLHARNQVIIFSFFAFSFAFWQLTHEIPIGSWALLYKVWLTEWMTCAHVSDVMHSESRTVWCKCYLRLLLWELANQSARKRVTRFSPWLCNNCYYRFSNRAKGCGNRSWFSVWYIQPNQPQRLPQPVLLR